MRDLVFALAMALVGLVIGWLVWGRGPVGSSAFTTDTLYVERTIRERDTVTVDRPETRVIYERHTDTVRVEVPVPIGLDRIGFISPTPIRVEGRDVRLTWWDPDSLRWQQDIYTVPRPRWRFVPASVSASALLPGAIALSAGPSLTRGAWTLSASYSALVWQGETVHGVSVGVRWEPWRWEW